ncbi:cell division protein FtsQ/DivIB [Candidatus Pelagibacter bacterium nBUS_36]|uniref:cell division protein FtsQ/DivIB n=1 Tax=Candidatus Pelagibacter bacterium nBUS_36 TaxID=3374194 RepID=UPI003EC0B528
MHQRKGKKILIYFFLLFIVGSINNISLNNLKLKKINYININGLGENDNAILLQEIKNLNLDNIFSINKNEIVNQMNANSLVENYNIFKRYPSSIDININKTKFLARINNNGKIFLVGSNGKLIENNFSSNQLPFIFGNPNIYKFLEFKKTIDQSKISYDEIKNLYFFSSQRWDLELKNNIIIKLSKNYTKKSLNLALEFLYSDGFRDVTIIDARIKNQIILND